MRNWVCGYVAIEPYDERRGLDEIGEVAVFVRRSFRSYGVGRQLMRVAQTEAARLGYRKLIGRVLADNHDSLRLCQATGWRTVGLHEQHARHGDRLRDVTILEYRVPGGLRPSRVMTDADYLRRGFAAARAAAEQGEVPVGAVVALGERILARAGNRTIESCDPTAHAEIPGAARGAAQAARQSPRSVGATLYVTVEPWQPCVPGRSSRPEFFASSTAAMTPRVAPSVPASGSSTTPRSIILSSSRAEYWRKSAPPRCKGVVFRRKKIILILGILGQADGVSSSRLPKASAVRYHE